MKKIIETDIEFINEEVFGDDKGHYYNVECFDGYAIAKLADAEDKVAPKELRLTYPVMEHIKEDDDLCDTILKYRGLYDKDKGDIHYGDIMLYCGIIEKIFTCGNTTISREDYESMLMPMNTSSLSDEDMQRLAEAIEYEMSRWKEWLDNGDISQDTYDEQWWIVFGECGLNFGMSYYEG
jgi:hypothetical protein